MSSRSSLLTALAAASAIAATCPVLLPAPPAAAAAAAVRLPNAVTRGVSASSSSVTEGGALTIRHRVLDSGTATLRSTTTRFYLSRNATSSRTARASSTSNPRSAPADVLLLGARAVPSLASRRQSSVLATTVGIPVGTAPGSYRVLACADDRGVAREGNEIDNCTAATTSLRVTAAPGTGTMALPSYADTSPWLPDALSVTWLKAMCQHTFPAVRMTPATAISRLKAMLRTAGGADVLTRLAASGLADDAAQAQRLAATGALQDSPGLALAGLLRAHDLEPRIGNHLVNAAAVAVGMGRPNEALALLDSAAPLDLRRGAMGINPQYDALVVRGEALVLTGRLPAARTHLQAARVAEPRLSEADAGLAAIEACSGHDALAGRYARRSRQRTQQPKTATEDPTTPAPDRPAPDLDLSRARETALRGVVVPETPSQGVDLASTYQAIDAGFQGEIQAALDRGAALQERLDGTTGLLEPAELDRRDGLIAQSSIALDTPALHDLESRLDTKIRLMADLRDDFFGGPGHEQDASIVVFSDQAAAACQGAPDSESCYWQELNDRCRPELGRIHTQWRGLLSEAQTVAGQYVADSSRIVSSYASNLADDAAHDLVLLQVTELERIAYSRLVEAALSFTNAETTWQQACVEKVETIPAPPTPGVPTPESDGACPELLRTTTFTLELGVSKLKVGCDKITQSFSAEAFPWVAGFVDLTWDIRAGQFTVFAGSKGQVKLGNALDLGFKSGIYLTSDGHGGIKDVGWRVGPSARLTEGIAEYTVAKSEIDISFLPVFRSTP